MKDVTDHNGKAWLHVGGIVDPDAQARAFDLVEQGVAAARERDGLPPRPARPRTLLCGCPRDPVVGPSRVDLEGGCVACSA